MQPAYWVALLVLLCSCSTTQLATLETKEERAVRESSLGVELARRFDSRIKFKKDPSVERFLSQMVKKLAGVTSEISATTARIKIISLFSRDFSLK